MIASQTTIHRALTTALIMALLTAIITAPILGVHIEQSMHGLTLHGSWLHSLYAALTVFAVQFFLALRLPLWKPKLPWAKHNEHHQANKLIRFCTGRGAIMLILITIGILLPLIGSRKTIDIGTVVLIYVMLGLGLNVVVGLAGLLDLGYVGFYAVGAYTYAILQQHGFGFWSCIPIAAVLAGTFGVLLGFPVLRLRGDYLAIVTLGFGEIIRILLNNLDRWTGGPAGISSIAAPTFFTISFERRPQQGYTAFHELFHLKYSSEYRLIFLYAIIFALVLLSLWIINRFLRMPVGRAWEALREDEIACRSIGLNPTLVKLSAFAIGATFAGIAGAFFAAKQGFVNPESFTFIESAIILAIVVLGGMGSQTGVILAAIALVAIPELAREFSQYRMLIFGCVMVLMMIWRPQGLVPAQRPKMELPE